MLKAYKTVLRASETEFVEKKSRFIGRCFPVADEAEALIRLDEIRKLQADATHNCWAYSIVGGINRFSDDGEPGGTAGMPIMDTLIRRDIQNAIVVVTRYFGGILLGSGGLVRAYSRSASDAVSAAGVGMMTPCSIIEFATDYSRFGGIEGFVRSSTIVDSIDFMENIRFRVSIKRDLAEGFMAEIVEKTDGRSSPAIVDERFIAVPED